MRKILRAGLRIAAATVLVCAVIVFNDRILAPAQPGEESAANDLLAGHSFYYAGDPENAIASYERALRLDPKRFAAWVNGAVVFAEIGRLDDAAAWYRRALALNPESERVATALSETELNRGRVTEAATAAEHALRVNGQAPYAWIAKGRVLEASGRADEAADAFARAVALRPSMTLAQYRRGRALALAGKSELAASAFAAAAAGDSYFTQARFGLAEALVRQRRYREARPHIAKLNAAAPANRNYQKLAQALAYAMRRDPGIAPPRPPAKKSSTLAQGPRAWVPPATPEIPRLRVGIGTDGLGRPLAWKSLRFSGNAPVVIREAQGNRTLASAGAGENWELRVYRSLKSRAEYIEIRDAKGFPAARSRGPIVLTTVSSDSRWIWIRGLQGPGGLQRKLRGETEITLRRGGLTVLNRVDLESYTHGVLTAEMPVSSPLEALKAQAVLARTHALFIKDIRRRHRAEGYDLCDGQHCQVYRGAQAETDHSRHVVNATSGRIVSYRGAVANVLYSSNCGGHTQSSSELQGWGEVPYFRGMKDAGEGDAVPHSPWQLRQTLREPARGYCAPSNFVYSGHARWSRVIPASDLQSRLDRSLGIGKLEVVIPLKRSRSGHLNSILVRGSKGSRIVDSEMRIRGLFGIGSQRSALFVMDTERRKDGSIENFVFYGGGWGHGVGLCQSGAMGRAQAGHSYAQIIQAYYRGIEIGNLRY